MADENPAPEIVTPPDISKRPTRPAILWASAALIAVSAAALTAESEKGAQRLRVALAYASEPSRILVQLELPRFASGRGTNDKSAGSAEMMRLAATVRELSADRDRLKSRIASLEQTLDDTTGSIKKQVDEVAAAQSAVQSAIKEQAPPAPSAPTIAVATMPSMTLPPTGPALSQWPHHSAQEASVPPPTPAPAPALAPAAQVASLPVPREAMSSSVSNKPPVAKKEFGADLGSAATLEALRAHWSAVKANYGPLLKGVQPRYFAHERKPGTIEYHLVLGPFTTAFAANSLCGRLTAARVYCRTAMFEGDRLATQ